MAIWTPERMIRRPAETSLRRRSLFLLALLVLPILLWLLRIPILQAAGGFLVQSQPPQKADIAVVLGGDEYGSRILTGGELVRRGYAPYALISYPLQFGVCDSGAGYAIGKGYPASYFRDLPNYTHSTREEAAVLDQYFRAHAIHKVLLVTSNFHTRRATKLMRRQDPALQLITIAAPDPYFTPSGWWKEREGRKTFLLEWTKTISVWLGQ